MRECLNATIPRYQRAVFTFKEGRMLVTTRRQAQGVACPRQSRRAGLAKACRPVGSQAENTNVVVSPTGVKRTAKLSLLRNSDTPRKLADLDRLDDLEICDVDDGDVVRHAIGRQKIFFVRGKRHVPDALAHEKI